MSDCDFKDLKIQEKDAKTLKLKLQESEFTTDKIITPEQIKEMDEFYNAVFQGKFGNPAEFWKKVFTWQAKQMNPEEEKPPIKIEALTIK